MKLYSGPLSLFTAKVRIALADKGLAYERVEVGWSREHRYEPHHPDVVALNPRKQVPVLVDGDVVVADSTLILEYLEDRSPEPPLLPRDAAGRARARQLEAAADEILFPHVWDLIESRFYPAGQSPDPARAERGERGVARYALDLDKEIGAGPFLCGAFGVADIANAVMLLAAAGLGAPVPADATRVHGWLARVSARESVRREFEEIAAFRASAGV